MDKHGLNDPVLDLCDRQTAARSETAPGSSGSESDERSGDNQSVPPSQPVVVCVVDWIVQSL